MTDSGKTNYQINAYDNLGHLVDLPYDPPCIMSNHPLFPKPLRLIMGGDKRQLHCHAQRKAWRDTLNFFNYSLRITK